jgi:pimeloyl-ACP methyl ester carboxylesterase
MSSRDESDFRAGREGDATYYTRRILYDDLAVVIRRFPTAESGTRSSDWTGRPFVLVHGIGVSSRYFHPAAAELTKFGPVFVVDLPGFGSAPDPHRDVTIVDHAGVLAKYLAEEGIANPVLVGHSMGTQVVSRLALDYPDATSSIVLMAPTMDPAARTFGKAARRLITDILRYEPPRVNLVVSFDYFFRCGIPYFMRQVPHLLGDRMEDRLPRLAAKALVMRGDKDVISPEGWSREVASLLRQGSYVTVKGPHVVMYTDPKRVAALIALHGRS